MSVGRGFRSPGVFRQMGLSGNPFVLRDPAGIVERVPPTPWIEALCDESWRVLVLHGESGLGKTTAAHFIAAEHARRTGGEWHYVRLPERRARFPALAGEPDDIWIVDSVQRVARWRRGGLRQTLEVAGRLVLAGHVDPTRGLFAPTVAAGDVAPAEVRGGLKRVAPPAASAAEVRATFATLCAGASRPGAAPPTLDPEAATTLVAATSGNRFAIHRALYLAFEMLADEGVRAAAIDAALARRALEEARTEAPELSR